MKKDRNSDREDTWVLWKWLKCNWERVFFSLIGVGLISYSIWLIASDQFANASIVFGIGFFCFLYANVARFKRFKGLGFEAELWEETKQEAEDLIEKLRNVVTIYSKQAILQKVFSGRWPSGSDWGGTWKLYDDLIAQHNLLGQQIDFSDVKKTVDDVFLFDMTYPMTNKIRRKIMEGVSKAQDKIGEEFGSSISDHEGYLKRSEQLQVIPRDIPDPAEVAKTENLAQRGLDLWREAKEALRRDFDVDIEIDEAELKRLREIAILFSGRPVRVTPELINLANKEPEH